MWFHAELQLLLLRPCWRRLRTRARWPSFRRGHGCAGRAFAFGATIVSRKQQLA
jgi:hypothetical protein